ncbi:hypothetical protein LTR28_007319 [Elasticomyces elasticus]|nr:hypothetical protein LTR28_007319 [Elasticomyces elasticus]
MGSLRNIALAVLAISLITFVALFGRLPALRKTPVGGLQRLLCQRLPALLHALDVRITGGRMTAVCSRLVDYLLYKKNPVVLIIYLGLLTSASLLFLYNASASLPPSLLAPVLFLLPLPYLFTYLCASLHPSINASLHITRSNHADRLRDYPYDRLLFRPGQTCTTCALPKPARSKHCSLCGTCIARCDHHCPWVNNCIGRSNQRYFLALLLSLFALETYGAYLALLLLSPIFPPQQQPTPTPFWSLPDLARTAEALATAIHRGGISIAGVGLLAATTAPLPLALLVYHIYLIWAGATTNESQKWADWREDMADGVVFKARLSAVSAHERGRADREGRVVACEDGVVVEWPVRSDQVVVRTDDGRPPVGQEALWERVWGLDGVDNIYDLGFWDNLMEVLKGR